MTQRTILTVRRRRSRKQRPILLTTALFFAGIVVMGGADQENNNNNNNCRLDIWVYKSFNDCESSKSLPDATGIMYADGMCHTIETKTNQTDPNYQLLPGTYNAICTTDGLVRIYQSGCTNNDCSSTTTTTMTITGTEEEEATGVCERDLSSVSSLFSQSNIEGGGFEEFMVQNPVSAVSGNGFVGKCRQLYNNTSSSQQQNSSVTFLLFGNCSGCTNNKNNGDGNDKDNTNTNTNTPSVIPTTMEPSYIPPTQGLVLIDSTETLEPTTEPTAEPNTEPTTADNNNNNNNTNSIRIESVSGTMIFGDMDDDALYSNDDAIIEWENVTTNHITEAATIAGYTIGEVITQYMAREELLSDQGQIISETIVASLPPRTNKTQRILQTNDYVDNNNNKEENGNAYIYFVVSISFPSSSLSTPETTAITAKQIFQEAFDTEEERTNYLIQLVNTKEDIFADIDEIRIVDQDGVDLTPPLSSSLPKEEEDEVDGNDNDGSAPSPASSPTTQNQPTNIPPPKNGDDNNADGTIPSDGTLQSNPLGLGIVIGTVFGSLFLILITGWYLYRRGRHDALCGSSSTRHKEIGESDPSSKAGFYGRGGGDHGADKESSTVSGSSPRQPRRGWTNEIIVDHTQDDISTLGGSMRGFNLFDAVNHQAGSSNKCMDEPTASVNVDYDFSTNRYRTGAINEDATIDDVNTRVSNPTIQSWYSTKSGPDRHGGMTLFADDDQTFEQMYAVDDEEALDQKSDEFTRNNIECEQTKTITHPDRGRHSNGGSRQHLLRANESSQSPIMMSQELIEVNVPPGLLGMVVDTPGGNVPVVRAIKTTSILLGRVMQGDQLVAVDDIDVTKMSAMQVSKLISVRSHLHRTLTFIRPPPESWQK